MISTMITSDKNEKTGKSLCSQTWDIKPCDRTVYAKGLCKKHHLGKWKQDHLDQTKAKRRTVYAATRNRVNAVRRDWAKRNPKIVMLMSARSRAKRKEIRFDLKEQDIVIPTHCPVLGIPLGVSKNTRDNSPSLDRVIPAFGYVRGNIRVISYRANRMKNDATLEEIANLYHWMLQQRSSIQ